MLPRLPFPDHDLASLYDRDTLRLTLPSGVVDLVPTDGRGSAAPETVRYLVGLWNPFGRPTSLSVNRQYAELAIEERPELASLRGVDFAEPAVVVKSRPDAQVWARRYGQPAFLRWGTRGVAVLDTETCEVVASWPVELRPVPARSCVMGEPVDDEPCRSKGGPWTSGSISAALVWGHDRETSSAALGDCTLCAGPRGGAIGLVDLSVRSRWDGKVYVVGPR